MKKTQKLPRTQSAKSKVFCTNELDFNVHSNTQAHLRTKTFVQLSQFLSKTKTKVPRNTMKLSVKENWD